MHIFIPTLGRVHGQRTFDNLPLKYKGSDRCSLVVYPEEAQAHKSYGRPVLVSAQKVRGIGHKRNFILKHCIKNNIESFVMLDDDLDFFVRGPKLKPESKTPFSLYPPTDQQLKDMFYTVQNALEGPAACASVSPREGSNRFTERVVMNTRVMRFLGYNTKVLQHVKADFSKAEMMCDFSISLLLHTHGFESYTFTKWAHNQPGSNAPGGCSATRTSAKQEADARELAAMFPKYVKLVEKVTKGGWGGMGNTRIDVRVAWAKAYADGRAS